MRSARLLPVIGLLGLGACQSLPAAPSGLLSSYDGLASERFSLRAAIAERRDDAVSSAIQHVYIRPAVLSDAAGASLDDGERQAVLREVDSRLCFELSRYFQVSLEPAPDAAAVHTVVSGIRPTGRAGSVVSAVAGNYIPVPLLDVRVPGTTGGLSVESEMVGPDGRQVAAITWSRDATAVGRESPSLSRIGDAIQLVPPMGDAVTRAFIQPDRPRVEFGEPDPCAAFGPRRNIPRWIADKMFGFATGLYQPEIAGLARPAQTAQTRPAP